MALYETVGGGEIEWVKQGGTARHEFLCGWAERFYVSPYPGQLHPLYPPLRVNKVKFVGEGPETGIDAYGFGTYELSRVIVDYSFSYTDIPLGDPPRITHTGTTEVMNTCGGRVRAISRIPIDMEDLTTATLYPSITINVDCAVMIDPEPFVLPILGSINESIFTPVVGSYSFPAGSLLFMDYEVQYQYDPETVAWYYRLTYKMQYRGIVDGVQRSWNDVYFPPIYLRSVQAENYGQVQYYQSQDVNKSNYVAAGSALDNTPVYMAAPNDVGIWEETDPLNYSVADWSALPLQVA